MTRLLANELLIMTFQVLLNETSFKYMNSICTVCKKWNGLIKLVIAEDVEFRLKSRLLIEFGFESCSTKDMSCDFLNSIYSIHLNDNNFEIYYSYFFDILENNEKRDMCIKFKYDKTDNNKKDLVEVNLGTLLFYRQLKQNSDELEVKYSVNWNYKDCMCISKKDPQYDSFNGIIIKIEKLIISLKKMCVILDLLDEKLNTEGYKYIIKKKKINAFQPLFVC